MAQFRYVKIQLETKDITTRLRGIILKIYIVYSPKPRRLVDNNLERFSLLLL